MVTATRITPPTTRNVTTSLDPVIRAPRLAPVRQPARLQVDTRTIEGARTRTQVRRIVPESGGIWQQPSSISIDSDAAVRQTSSSRIASPVEFLLHSLAADITASITRFGQSLGVQVNSVRATVNAEFDSSALDGYRPFTSESCRLIQVAVTVNTNAPVEVVQEVFYGGIERSVVFNLISEKTPVILGLAE